MFKRIYSLQDRQASLSAHEHINRIPQQYSQSLVVRSGTITLSPGQCIETAFGQWKIKENHNIKNKLAQKLYDENIWHRSITKVIKFQFFIYITGFIVVIFDKFCCFTQPFVPKLKGKSVVPEMTIRDSEYCSWSSLKWSVWCIWYSKLF